MPELNVLFCHGIGSARASYAKGTVDALRSELGKDRDRFEFRSVLWSDVLDSRQSLYMNRSIASGDLDWVSLRRELVVSGLGDACAYLGTGDGASPYYNDVQDRVARGFEAFTARRPTVILAHSMGCAVMVDYLRDHGVRRHGVRCMVMFGSNLLLFLLGRRPGQLDLPPIPRVYNLYDSDDLLAYPMDWVAPEWITGEYRIQTGSVFGAHTGYWADPDFVSWVAKCLQREVRNG